MLNGKFWNIQEPVVKSNRVVHISISLWNTELWDQPQLDKKRPDIGGEAILRNVQPLNKLVKSTVHLSLEGIEEEDQHYCHPNDDRDEAHNIQ
jgi:hypothetical protein